MSILPFEKYSFKEDVYADALFRRGLILSLAHALETEAVDDVALGMARNVEREVEPPALDVESFGFVSRGVEIYEAQALSRCGVDNVHAAAA